MLKDGNMIDVLHVCEFTLQFFTRKDELVRFQRKNLPKNRRHPPGNGKKMHVKDKFVGVHYGVLYPIHMI